MLPLTFTLLTMVIVSTHANNWAVPCTSGSCGYDWAGDGKKTATSSMMLTGPNQVLSDITPAAGWQVMGCNPSWSQGTHNITMVCSGTPQQMAHCNHLYVNGGAENTVVRLPQNCGTGPFARVQGTFESANQSVPPKLTRRNGVSANSSQVVRCLTLDYDFAKVPPSRGTLSLSIASASSGTKPLTPRHLDVLHKRGRGRMLAQRGLFGDLTSEFGKATSAVGNVASSVKSDVQQATSAIASVATNVASHAESVVSQATSAIQSVASQAASATAVNKTGDTGNIPITISKSFPLLNTQIGCGGNSASLEIDMDAEVDVGIDLGFTIAGTVIPPKLQDVSAHGGKFLYSSLVGARTYYAILITVLSGGASATFNIQAQAQGSFDTGSLQLFKSGLPGLSIPGIFTLGPEFTISAELQMVNLELEADMSVTTGFTLPNLALVFPQSHGQSSGSAKQNGNNTMKLSASQPSVNVNGTVIAHVIPRMDLGVDFLNGVAKASVFMDVDISGAVGFQVSAGPAVNPTTATPENNAADQNATHIQVPTTQSSDVQSKSTSLKSTPSNSPSPVNKTPPKPKATQKALKRAESINGCVDVTGAITVSGGLDGALKPLFNEAITFTIFQTSGKILNKCFGNGVASPPAKRSGYGGATVARAYRNHEVRAVKPKPKPSPSPSTSSGGTKNDITPQQANSRDKSKLSCSSTSLTPLSGLLSLI